MAAEEEPAESWPSRTEVNDMHIDDGSFAEIEPRAGTGHAHTRRLLYTSHFLSTWNSRAFEFGAFLFLAALYPNSLLPASVYALARAGSAAVLSPWLGKYIDRAQRLRVVQISIVGQRVSVTVSCALLFVMFQFEQLRNKQIIWSIALGVLSVLACVEKLSAVMNTISVERDWVVVIADGDEERLGIMNSQMRRIDLFCKLAAPLFVSSIDSVSSKTAVLATGAMTAFCVALEYFAISKVYAAVPALANNERDIQHRQSDQRSWAGRLQEILSSVVTYFRHPAFLPSFSLALLYLTVLSFNGQLIVWLLAAGLPSYLIGILRGVSAIFELSATWLAPRIIGYIGPIRAGIWFINWQIFCVCIACAFFWLENISTFTVIGTVAGVVASRVGLWGFDLSIQIIVQEEVEAELRGTFSSQEFAFQNVFEMLSFASTIVFARPQQFKYPAAISAAAVGIAAVLYAAFVRVRRGHLVHLSECIERHGSRRQKGAFGHSRREWRALPQDEEDGGDTVELSESRTQAESP